MLPSAKNSVTFHGIPVNTNSLMGEIPVRKLEKMDIFEITQCLNEAETIQSTVAFILSLDYSHQLHIETSEGVNKLYTNGLIEYTSGNISGSPSPLYIILRE